MEMRGHIKLVNYIPSPNISVSTHLVTLSIICCCTVVQHNFGITHTNNLLCLLPASANKRAVSPPLLFRRSLQGAAAIRWIPLLEISCQERDEVGIRGIQIYAWTINEPHLVKKQASRCYTDSFTAQDILCSPHQVARRWGLKKLSLICHTATFWLSKDKYIVISDCNVQ